MRVKNTKGALVCLVLLAGIFLTTALAAHAADKGPIKVGILVSYTGPAPMQANSITMGAQLAFQQAGEKAGGRSIQVFKEDAEVNPTVALTKLRRLVEEKGVSFVVGPVFSHVAMAIHGYISKSKVILIIPCAFTRVLTSPEKARENIFRTVETTDQGNYPMGAWMIKNTPYRKVVGLGHDYAAGHDSVDAFKAGFEEAGGKVVKEFYTKIGTMDFSSLLTAMQATGADAIYAFISGMDGVRLAQQLQEFGLKKRLPLFGYSTVNDDPYLDQIGEAGVGTIASSVYTPSLDTPENHTFVKAYTERYNQPPNHYSEYGYVAGRMIVATAEALKGEVEDTSRVAKEMKRVAGSIVAPSGPLAFDQYNQRIMNVYVVRTEKRAGKFVNVVIDKIGKVSQADCWKWWRK